MILTIIQARMGSKRLPGKALASLHGQPLIWHQLERLRAGRCPTKVV
ncbi:MAG: cytidylyltransferase domain-containing protein, partial [Caulobacter sp.]